MAHASNSVLLAIAFIEGSAALILLVIYSLARLRFPRALLPLLADRLDVFLVLEASKIPLLLRGGSRTALLVGHSWSLLMAAFFFAAALECAGSASG